MIGCLLLALILGIIIGIFWSKANNSKDNREENSENLTENHLNELEELYAQEQAITAEYSKKNRELKGELLKKMTLLSTTSDTLKKIQSKTPTFESQEIIDDLKNQLKMKNRELKEFEEVLVKAEETIENLRK